MTHRRCNSLPAEYEHAYALDCIPRIGALYHSQEDKEEMSVEASESGGDWVDIEPSGSSISDIPQWKLETPSVERPSGLADLRAASRTGNSTQTRTQPRLVQHEREDPDELQLQLLESKSAHMRDVKSLRHEIDRLQQNLQDVRTQWDASQESEQHAYGQLRSTQAELTALRVKYEDLDLRFATARASSAHPRALEPLTLDLQAEVRQLRGDLAQAQAQVQGGSARIAAQQAEIVRLQAESREKSEKTHALSAQLSSVLAHDASEIVRVHSAEAEVQQLRAELEKRLSQVHKLVEALTRVKDREAATNAALEAAKGSLQTVQRSVLSASAESERWKAAVAVLEAQHEQDVQQIEELAARVQAMEEKEVDDARALSSAVESAAAVRALSVALEASREEVSRLSEALAEARAEGRKETLLLHRKVEEQAALISALQADLSAATAAVTFSLPAVPPSSHGGPPHHPSSTSSAVKAARRDAGTAPGQGGSASKSGSGPAGGVASMLQALLEGESVAEGAHTPPGEGQVDGRSNAVRREESHEAHASVESPLAAPLNAEITRLRLQCESVSRRLAVREEQVAELEREQEELVEVNERLRSAVEEARASVRDASAAPSIEKALSHADYIRKRGAGAGAGGPPASVPTTHRSAAPTSSSAGEDLAAAAAQVRVYDLALRLVLSHVWRVEGTCDSARHLLSLVHTFVQQVRAHMQASESTADGATDHHALSLLSGQGQGVHVREGGQGGEGHDVHLHAQLARLQRPVEQVLASQGGSRSPIDFAAPAFNATPFSSAALAVQGGQQHLMHLAQTDTVGFMAAMLGSLTGGKGSKGAPLTLTDPILLRTLLLDCAGRVEQVQGAMQERAAASLGQACVTQ